MSTQELIEEIRKSVEITEPSEINSFIDDSPAKTADNVADALALLSRLMTLQEPEQGEGAPSLQLDPPEVTGLYFILAVMEDALRFHVKQGGAQ